MRKVFCLVVLTFFSARLVASSNGQEISMPRAMVVEAVEQHIEVQLGSQLDGTDSQNIVSRVKKQVAEQAPGALPENLVGPSWEILGIATKMPLLITYPDDSYICAAVKLHIMGVPVAVAYLQAFPPPTAQDRSQVQASVERARAALEAKMDEALIPLNISGLKKDDITRATNIAIGNRNQKAGNPLSYTLVKPLADADINTMIADFEMRLRDNRETIKEQIEAGVHRFGLGQASTSMTDFKLVQVLAGPQKFIFQQTSDPRRKAFTETKMGSKEWLDAEKEYNSAIQNCTKPTLQAEITTTKP